MLQARGRIVFDYQSASNDGKNIKASLNDQFLKKITIDFPASLKASLERSDLNGFKLTFPADPTVSVMFHDLPAISDREQLASGESGFHQGSHRVRAPSEQRQFREALPRRGAKHRDRALSFSANGNSWTDVN
jgi:hypothetical protein